MEVAQAAWAGDALSSPGRIAAVLAALDGRGQASVDDIRKVAHPVIGHRLDLGPAVAGSHRNRVEAARAVVDTALG